VQALKLLAVIHNVVVAALPLKTEQFKQQSHGAFWAALRGGLRRDQEARESGLLDQNPGSMRKPRAIS